MQPYNLTELLSAFQQLTEDVVLYLPRTSDIRQLAQKFRVGSKMTVMHYCMEGASKVCYTYPTDFACSSHDLNHRLSARITVPLHSLGSKLRGIGFKWKVFEVE